MNHLCNRHPENSSNFLTLRDFPRGATRSFKPLHKTDVRRAPQRRTPSQSRTVPRCLPPIRSYAMPTGPARRPRTVKTRFILSETPWAAPSLYGGNVDSRPIVLKTKLSFLKSGQGTVHIFASIFRRATNQPAIQNRNTYVKWKEILVMPAQRSGERQAA